MPESNIVFLEFNELTPELMDRFIANGKLPNFEKLRNASQVYISQAEEKAPDLEPWIQWVNVHTGVPFSEHGVRALSEGHKLRQNCLWDLISETGLPVWICGSMNARYNPAIRGFVLPDPWSTDVAPHPASLHPYFRFVQQSVLEHTKDRIPLNKSDSLKFLKFMVTHGLSRQTVSAIARQLISEKRTRQGRWKRAFILDMLQFDLFSSVYKRLRPRFSTFFLNSTAHMQHKYWREMEPELFKVQRKTNEHFESAILMGYQAMDALVGRIMKLVGDQAIIIMGTALGQQPCLTYEETGMKNCYRPTDFEKLLTFAGFAATHRVAPVMAEQFWVHAEKESDAIDLQNKLLALKVDGSRAMLARREGSSVLASCAINVPIDHEALLSIENGSSQPFFDIFYPLGGGKSGMHHPDGMLWIRQPGVAPSTHREKVGLISIAPTILQMLNIDRPSYMRGESLISSSHEVPQPELSVS